MVKIFRGMGAQAIARQHKEISDMIDETRRWALANTRADVSRLCDDLGSLFARLTQQNPKLPATAGLIYTMHDAAARLNLVVNVPKGALLESYTHQFFFLSGYIAARLSDAEALSSRRRMAGTVSGKVRRAQSPIPRVLEKVQANPSFSGPRAAAAAGVDMDPRRARRIRAQASKK